MTWPTFSDGLIGTPWAAVPLIFGAGVLTSLTPCIYPMIPITAAVVGGQTTKGETSRWRVVRLTTSYVIGLALSYALLGLVAGLSRSMFGVVSSSPWTSFAVANWMLLSALMMLEALPVPTWPGVAARAARLHGGGRSTLVFLMGAASGLVVAPCAAPVMGAVLGWVAATQSALWGFIYLFVFALGMSTALLVIGVGVGWAIRWPRAGVWMLWIKRGLALAMLALAEYYLLQTGERLI